MLRPIRAKEEKHHSSLQQTRVLADLPRRSPQHRPSLRGTSLPTTGSRSKLHQPTSQLSILVIIATIQFDAPNPPLLRMLRDASRIRTTYGLQSSLGNADGRYARYSAPAKTARAVRARAVQPFGDSG